MTPAANAAIEDLLAQGRAELRGQVRAFLAWLDASGGRATAEEAQARLTRVRLRVYQILGQRDVFADVLLQRAEHDTGVWLAGLDVAARDLLVVPGGPYRPPPIVCYLERGHGAAIRRAHTPLPGGELNPVAVVRIPRERMLSSTLASSLAHEVGHQASVLLDLIPELQEALRRAGPGGHPRAWAHWERWSSEVLADLWSVGRVGVAQLLGLMGVVSLPRALVFQGGPDRPHPIPWVRVQLAAAMGQALYPHPQWERLARVWRSLYPLSRAGRRQRSIAQLVASLPRFVRLLVRLRPAALGGSSLRELLAPPERQPARLARTFARWERDPEAMRRVAPGRAFAVLGQARADGILAPEIESRVLSGLLTEWALRRCRSARALRVPPQPVITAAAAARAA